MGRFINADDAEMINITVGTILKHNIYLYCNGNPIRYVDKDGRIASWITGGNIFKIKRYVGMVQKVGAGMLEIKLLRAFYKMRSLIVNMVVKSFGKRKGESWFTAIKRFVSYAANKI